MGPSLVRLVFVVLLTLFGHSAYAQDAIGVDVDSILSDVSRRPLGINVNFLLDDDGNRPEALRKLADGLRAAGVKYLRYPGGEKADGYLWSVPPYTSSIPTLARWAPGDWPSNTEWPSYDRALVHTDGFTFRTDPLNFDEFMEICRQIDCVPTVVVCYDSIYKPAQPGGFAPSRSTVLEAAREWVRYANITRGYNVQYWEIGNESYLPHYNGQANAADYARDLVQFSREMKGVDPRIKIGANGESLDWWQTVLTGASSAIDFLAVHNYPPWEWGSYSHYQYNDPRMLDVVDTARTAIAMYAPAADRGRLELAVTEANAVDWSGSWPNVNDTGHALVVFDMFGQHMTSGVEFMQLWNTRWSGSESASVPRLIDTFDANNNLQATGAALAIWGQFLKDKMVFSSSTRMVRTYATYSPTNTAVTAFLINKDTQSREVTVRIDNFSPSVVVNKWIFKGANQDDVRPSLNSDGLQTVASNVIPTTLEPVSITVLDISTAIAGKSVPSLIEAEDFDAFWDSTDANEGGHYRTTAVDIEPATDAGGGFNVGWVDRGEWLEYSIVAERSGDYRIVSRVASPVDGTSFRTIIDGDVVGGAIDVPNTGGWQSWQSVSTAPLHLNAGRHSLRIHTETGWFNLNWIRVESAPTQESPMIIEAEDFEAYWDSTDVNEGGEHRSTGVDIEPTTDAGGGYNVGWIAAGEWLEYTIDAQSGGLFAIDARIASPLSGTNFSIEIDGVQIGSTLGVPHTGSWQSWDSVHTAAYLSAGLHKLRVVTATGGFNINKLILTRIPGS